MKINKTKCNNIFFMKIELFFFYRYENGFTPGGINIKNHSIGWY